MTQKESLLQQYSHWLQMRNYSLSTYKAYMGTIRKFWQFCEQRKHQDSFEKEDSVQTYLAYRKTVEKRDFSTVNGDYSALMWFYKYILNRDWNVRKLIRPKKEKRLPKYISPQQVKLLIESTAYKKHRIMFLLFYSTGLRLSELRMLKWEDVKFDDGVIHVQKGKGYKDRLVILQPEMEKMLRAYRTDQAEKQKYLFEGNTPNKVIAPRSVQWAFINARKKAGLPNWVTPHVLRHSYATIVLKNGTDLLTLKELLGHKKLATTTRYLHLNTAYLKKSYNPLSDQCLDAPLQEAQRPLR